jgi:hypothetical protein
MKAVELLRNKEKECLKGKVYEFETNSKSRNIRHTYKDLSEVK